MREAGSVSPALGADQGAAAAAGPLVSFSGVAVEYSGRRGVTRAIENVSLDLEQGSFTCVVGRSGCGKTTLLHLLAGLLKPTRGTVTLRGKPISGCDKDRGMVFQSTSALLPWLNVSDNIGIGLRMAGMPKAQRQAVVDELLGLLDLSDFRDHRIYELSGGMQQRVAIGRVLAMEPEILLMDEPFGALDALTRTMLQDSLREIWRAKRFTAMFITHNVEEALTLGTDVVVMGDRPGHIRSRISVPGDDTADRKARLASMQEDVLARVMSA
jgi:ABC-type nitrate/sulfonate/bicarbonate transport system ATPase subunit